MQICPVACWCSGRLCQLPAVFLGVGVLGVGVCGHVVIRQPVAQRSSTVSSVASHCLRCILSQDHRVMSSRVFYR